MVVCSWALARPKLASVRALAWFRKNGSTLRFSGAWLSQAALSVGVTSRLPCIGSSSSSPAPLHRRQPFFLCSGCDLSRWPYGVEGCRGSPVAGRKGEAGQRGPVAEAVARHHRVSTIAHHLAVRFGSRIELGSSPSRYGKS